MSELIEKLKNATEGSRRLDFEIHALMSSTRECPHYTTSLDDAFTLLKPEHDIIKLSQDPSGIGWFIGEFKGGEVYERGEGISYTRPLALCIAALQAHENSLIETLKS